MTNTMKRLAVLLIGTLFILCVAIVLAVSLPVSTAFAAEGEPEVTIHDHADGWTELTAAGGTIGEGSTAENPALYYLTSDVTLTTDITVADNATVTLCLNGYKLTGAGTSAVITVGAGADFTLEDCSADASAPAGRGVITGGIGFLDEYSARHGGGVYISGNSTFTMNGGTISGNTATFGGGVGVDNDGTFTMNGGTISGNTANFDGGGVELVNGTFTMTGGTISGNSAYDWGGGVYVRNNSTFTMEGGTITDNTAKTFGGGVYVAYGTFTMSGGTISNNSAVYNDDGGNGGGVGVDNYGTFTMNGGTISGNTATVGGGVGVDNDGTFTMNGGTISGNTANFDGGGVELVNGTFTMTGGTISGNSAYDWGGGVYVRNNSTFTMEGGTITDNTAKTFGGGVYVAYGTFTMSGGTISNNSAVYNDDGGNGGGVGVDNYGTFTMNGGTISDNTANYGGGVYARYGTFTLKGGTISDNVATRNGGGVYVAYGTSTMNSGTISGNTAANGGGIYCGSGCSLTLNSSSVITGNKAYGQGGGIYLEGIAANPCTVAFSGNATVNSNTEYRNGGTAHSNNVYALNSKITFNNANALSSVQQNSIVLNTSSCTLADGKWETDQIGPYFELQDGSEIIIAGGYYSTDPAQLFTIADTARVVQIDENSGDNNYDAAYPWAVYPVHFEYMSGWQNGSLVYDGQPIEKDTDFTLSLEYSHDMPFYYWYKAQGADDSAYVLGLPADAGTYTVKVGALYLKGSYKEYWECTFDVTIAKATPVYTTPTDLTICADHTLADIALPSGWTWKDSSVAVGEAGEKTFAAVFTPEDTLNYNTVEESVTVTVTAHTGGTATCTHKAVCSVCGMEYGELAPHVFDQKVATAEYLASEATCTQKATYYYSCVCGEKGTETFEHGELAEHTAVEISAVEATCTQSGMTAGSKCSVCGEILVAPEEIASLGHVDENGDELCDRCGFDMSIPEFTIKVTGGTIEGAIGSTVIVEENGSVTVVASEAPEGKEFKGWSIDGGETIISAEAAYTFTASEDTVLTAVFADKQSDVKPGGEITPENPEGLSGGAIAGIVIGSVLGALIIAYGVCALLYKKKIVKGAFFAKIYPFIKD